METINTNRCVPRSGLQAMVVLNIVMAVFFYCADLYIMCFALTFTITFQQMIYLKQ